jgi:hypothetical protein
MRTGAQPEFFIGAGGGGGWGKADPEAIYNMHLLLKIML